VCVCVCVSTHGAEAGQRRRASVTVNSNRITRRSCIPCHIIEHTVSHHTYISHHHTYAYHMTRSDTSDVTSSYVRYHIIMHTMSHHHTYYVTSSHIISHPHTYDVTSSYIHITHDQGRHKRCHQGHQVSGVWALRACQLRVD